MKHINLDTRVVNIKLHWGGLGDQVARIPAIVYAIKNFRHAMFYIYAPTYIVDFYKKVLQSELEDEEQAFYTVLEMDHWERRLKSINSYVIDFKPEQISSLTIPLVDYAYLNVNNRLPEKLEDKSYPEWYPVSEPPAELGQYVVVTTGFTSEVREWKVNEINEFIRLVKENTNLNVALLGAQGVKHDKDIIIEGKFDEGIDTTQVIDLRDKTTIIQAADILAGSVAVVGLDNGLLHLASCTDTNVIWGFTSVEPSNRVPVRRGVYGRNSFVVTPSRELSCRFCQTKFHFIDHKFTKCMQQRFNYTEDIPCLKDMKATSFFRILEKKILSKMRD